MQSPCLPRWLFGVVFLGLSAAHGAPVATPHVEAELVSEYAALEPGKAVTVALRLKMDKGWHTYWRYPGETGLPTTIAWRLPAGFTAGQIQWPYPTRFDIGPIANYGYENEVFLLTDVRVPASARIGDTATLAARADWLVCREVCIPDGADLTLAVQIAAQAPAHVSPWATAIANTRAALPLPLQGWEVNATRRGAVVDLDLIAAAQTNLANVQFFPYDEGKIEPSAAQNLRRSDRGYVLRLEAAKQPVGEFKRVAGVLVAREAWGAGLPRAVTIDVPLTILAGAAASTSTSPAAKTETLPGYSSNGANLSLPVAMLFALLGGALLNLMPCVFPVLSLKVLGFAKKRGHERDTIRAHGLVYAAGVTLSFVALAALLATLRAAGTQLGWGFQLQSPVVVTALALLFFALALNLSGVFEFGIFVPSALATKQVKNSYANSFLSGVLVAVIASPCTAPFMGAALGFALTQSAFAAFVVFGALGIGMALPYVLLAWFPAWLRHLPRPGVWMQRLRHLLAFPLYATVVWLTWVLALQEGIEGAIRLLGLLVMVALAAWLYAQRGVAWRIAAVGVIAASGLLAWPLAAGGGPVPTPAASAGWEPFAPARVAELNAAGKPVFVDFTAAWCVTCQVNKRLVLESGPVRDAFAQHRVSLLRADWTRRDPVITQALADLGRNGVPVYVLYRPGHAPLLLPELLREQIVLDALNTL